MVSSCSSPPQPQAVVSKSQSMEEDGEEEIMGPYQLPSRNNISRRYHRKDDNSAPPYSPTVSEILDGVEEDDIVVEVGGGKEQQQQQQETRRNNDVKVSEEDEEEDDEEEDDWGIIDDPMFEQRIYDSPRLICEDSDIFPPADSHESYQDPQQRWSLISDQAGPHRQDGASLMVRRHMKPASLRRGIMSKFVATRVRSLSLWLDHKEDILPQWLDVITTLFPNLEHLTLSQDYFEGEEEIEVSSRMRRLYILYRLPDLLSIDGKAVTRAERSIARPSTPNGERVQRNDWMDKKTASSLLDNEDDEEEDYQYEETAAIPANASIGNATAMELGAELAQLTEKIAILHDDDDQNTNNPRKTKEMDEESLAGEMLVDLTAGSSFPSGEQREDLSSDPGSKDRRDEGEQLQNIHRASSSSSQQAQNAPATSEPAAAHAGRRKSAQAPSRTARSRAHPDDPSTRSNRASTAQIQHTLLSQPSTADTLELVSVASSHHEWTAACGVLSFRSDRACAPRLRLNFCGRGNRKRIADDKKESNGSSFKLSKTQVEPAKVDGQDDCAAENPRQQLRPQMDSRLGRESTNAANDFRASRSPLRDKYAIPGQESSPNRQPTNNVDSSTTANQKLPPSKSLSSPFPMQFRERTSSLRISTAETDLAASKARQNVIPSSPRARGSVAMDTITKPMTLTTFAPPSPPHTKTAPAGQTVASAKPHSASIIGRPVTKGELPPPCPPAARRKVGAASLLQTDAQERRQARRARKMERRKRAFQENARSTSVFDEMEDDTEDDSSSSEDDTDGPIYSEEQYSSIHEGNDW